jgi:HEAT repeat protein
MRARAGWILTILLGCGACEQPPAARPATGAEAEAEDTVSRRLPPEHWAARLRDPSPAARREALANLGESGNAASAYAPLIVPLLADRDERTGFTAAWALAHMGMGAHPLLIAELDSRNARVRERAAYGVGEMGPAGAEASERLHELASDPDPDVRNMATWAADQVRLRRMVADPTMLLTAGLEGTRAERLEAVARLEVRAPSSRFAVRELIVLLGDSVPAIRARAVEALAMAGPQALPSLSAALSHRNRLIRKGALLAISRIHRVF